MTKGVCRVLGGLVAVVFVVGGLLVFVHAADAASDKVAFVDTRAMFEQYQKTKDADAKLTELANAKQKERDALVEAIRRMKDEMAVLADSSEEKKTKQVEIDKKIKDLQVFDEKSRGELQQIRDANIKEILNDLDAVVRQFGDKKGYDYLLSANALVYKNDKLNVTEELIKEVNKNYKK